MLTEKKKNQMFFWKVQILSFQEIGRQDQKFKKKIKKKLSIMNCLFTGNTTISLSCKGLNRIQEENSNFDIIKK
jgi:hypothetical protein